MNRFLKLLLSLLFIFIFYASVSAAPSVISESAVLMDADTGQVLYDKEMHSQKYPASITKIATVICGLENGNLDGTVVMSDEAVWSVPRDSSHIALDVGEEITLEQACYAALLESANDACNGIAEYCGGTIPDFVRMMNELAEKTGAQNTHFTNTNGLPDKDHYTTAYDMACICRYAIKNEVFRKIFGTYKYTMPPNNKQKEQRNFSNSHYMISVPAYLYDGIIGGKTGFTTEALNTLVTAAERDGRTLIAVVMKSSNKNDKYTDTKALLDYGFENFDSLMITNADLPRGCGYKLDAPIRASVPKGYTRSDVKIKTTMENGQDLIILYSLDDQELGRFPCKVSIDASAEVPQKKASFSWRTPFLILGVVILSVIGLFLLLILAIIIRKKIYRAIRRRRRRRNRRR